MPLPSLAAQTEAWFLDEGVALHAATALRTPSDPLFRWGNLLYLAAPPLPGSRAAWEARFDEAFADLVDVAHATFAWSGEDGALAEFAAAGYETDANLVRTASAATLARDVERPEGFGLERVRGDDGWATILELQMQDDVVGETTDDLRAHRLRRIRSYRAIERGARPGLTGGWFVATIDGQPVASMGVYVRARTGRFQHVHVVPAARRRGVATAMVRAVAERGIEAFGAERLVVMGDEGTPADGIYARLGFAPVERYVGACLRDRRNRRASGRTA